MSRLSFCQTYLLKNEEKFVIEVFLVAEKIAFNYVFNKKILLFKGFTEQFFWIFCGSS